MSTPRSPTKPKGSRNVPRPNTVMASNDPLTARPPAPKTLKVRSLVTPKFTAEQHYVNKAKQIHAITATPSLRCQKIPAKVKRIGRKPQGTRRISIKVGDPLALIRDLSDDDALPDIRHLFDEDQKKRKRSDDEDEVTKPRPRRVKKGHKNAHNTSMNEETLSADSRTLSRTTNTETISEDAAGTYIPAHPVFLSLIHI